MVFVGTPHVNDISVHAEYWALVKKKTITADNVQTANDDFETLT